MSMTIRENTLAILRHESYERLPLVHFGFWIETLQKWCAEGHFSETLLEDVYDGSDNESEIARLLGFDFNWFGCLKNNPDLSPCFERVVEKQLSDGTLHVRDRNGVTVLEKPGLVSISSEIDHLLTDRDSWEEHYKWRLQYSEERVSLAQLEALKNEKDRPLPLGLHCGSLFGLMRDIMGLEGVSYLYCDDEKLYDEIIETFGALCYKIVERTLETGVKFDYAHFWEDICYKNGPLVTPQVFADKVGPQYKKITDLLHRHGVDIISVDCDGWIDSLIPTWLENGVNTMFPIEVGTWEASFAPWHKEFGQKIKGVGGMNKSVFSLDFAAIDKEIERLVPLIQMGGYIPCPDHRIAPDAKWENVRYYCEKLRESVK